MFARLLPAILSQLLLFGVGAPLFAQPIAINRCKADSLRILPPVGRIKAHNSVTLVPIENRFRFHLAWERLLEESCHKSAPSPIVEGQDSVARWVYFWDFGDGTFSRDSAPEHVFPAGTYHVKAVLKPIYSDDDDPVGRMVDTTIVVSEEDTPNYPNIIPANSKIALNANWPASRPEGYLTFALTYPKIRQTGEPGRTISLAIPDAEFELVDVQTGPAPTSESPTTWSYNEKTYNVYDWRIEQPENTHVPSAENSIFVQLRVRGTVADLLPDTASSMTTTIVAMIKIDEPNSSAKGNVLGTTKFKQDKTGTSLEDDGVANTSLAGGVDDITFHTIALNWASDPNYMTVTPEIVEPGTKNALLTYKIGFYNGGTATADTIRVDAHLEPALLHLPAFSELGHKGVTFPPPTSGLQDGDHVIRWATNYAHLPSLHQSQTLGFDSLYCFGDINFTLQTKPNLILKAGDTIHALAHIRMERSEVTTNAAVVRVKHLYLKHPCVFGLKFQYNLPREADDLSHRNGFNVALTVRKPLGKISNPENRYTFAARIPKAAFPMFWWQAELGYGQTNLQQPEVDSFRLGHLDLTPFLLRFIAKKPDLRLGSTGVKRGWGLSAGYTASFLLHGQVNGAAIDWGNYNFGERLDHAFSASLDVLNLIGQPGLSFGFGWRWRNTAITGERQWYQHPFVYAHYTFK